MSYSHRDHRALRELGTGTGLFVGATVALVAIALAVPHGATAPLAVAALAVLGGVFLFWADHLTDTYARDLARVREGADAPPRLRAEVGSDVGFDREGSGRPRPSPHRRGGGRRGPTHLPGRED